MNIILGVTGSISAYKACDIVSGLMATGHDVQVVMTEAAKDFIPEIPLAVLSKREVISSFNAEAKGEVYHITKVHWADLLLIAPATANTIAKIANGQADNVLTAMALAFNGIYSGRRVVAPAMNNHMYENPTTMRNLLTLQQDKWDIIEPAIGVMACGDNGQGVLPKPRLIVERINNLRDIND